MTVYSFPNVIAGSASRRRRSGSILIIVVALLTLVALIGTALIATARIDRYSTRAYVRTATLDAIHDQFLDQVESEVERTLLQDQSKDVDSFCRDTWLAERLPIWDQTPPALPSIFPPGNRNPMWAYISGNLTTQTDANAYTPNRAPYTDFEPPLQENPSNPVSVAPYIRMNPVQPTNTADFPHLNHPALPTSISLTYPANHPVESIRKKTRTFPALLFSQFGANTNDGIFLAADADGDGIADSVLRRMTPTPLDGVTYYYAIRIVDNASAININTAWSRDNEHLFAGANQRTFFTSNIGLYELLSPDSSNTSAHPNPTGRPDRDNEIAALNEYRFGYADKGYPTNPSFNPFVDTGAIPALTTGQQAIADADNNATYGNASTPTLRPDFSFASQAEALDTQLAWRIENPGNRAGVAGYTPPPSRDVVSPASGSPFQFAAFSATDGASLAYRFCMINSDVAPSDVESRLLISAYQSAPNYVGAYGTADLPNWKFYPANRALRWFQWLDYENPALDANGAFDEYNASGGASGVRRFPSVRPLLTTWNPVTDRIVEKYNTAFRWNQSFPLTNDNNAKLLYPGMMFNDVKTMSSTRFKGTWDAGTNFQYGDIVEDPNDGLYYMYVWNANGNSPLAPNQYNPPPALAAGQTRSDYWDLQPFVSGQVKTSVNTAGFPELWRAYFETMTDDTGTAVPAVIGAAVSQFLTTNGADSLNDPYYGGKWDPASMNDLVAPSHPAAMFRSPIRSPEPIGLPPHRLTPYQTAVLRSAVAAVNTIDLRTANTAAGNQDVTAKTFTLYDTDNVVGGTPTNPVPQYRVTVYGTKRQPYITEVYANNDINDYSTAIPAAPAGLYNPSGYIAIELHNPYNQDIVLTNWRMAYFDRRLPNDGGTYAQGGATLTEIINFGAGVVVPAGGYLIVENYNNGVIANGAASYRPPSTSLQRTGAPPAQPNVNYTYAPLGQAFGREIVLLRPREINTAVPINQITDMVPVDSYDLTGLELSTTACYTWHYVRSTQNWQFVYPGRYDASVALGVPRHQGTYATAPYNPAPVLADPSLIGSDNTYDEWNPRSAVTENPPFGTKPADPVVVPGQPVTLGGQVVGGAIQPALPTNAGASYPATDVFSIQLVNTGMPGPNPAQNANNLYPFGTFARNGDILQVPFIGAYKIELLQASGASGIDPGAWPAGYIPADGTAANPSILDFNSVTMDAVFAEDTDQTNNVGGLNGSECVGRFCPRLGSAIPSVYDWAKNLFKYVDVRSPANDYFPNFDPGSAPYRAQSVTPTRPQAVANKPTLVPHPVNAPANVTAANVVTSANLANEDYAARQGRLNINTAPATALKMVPFVAQADSTPDPARTKAVADAVAAFRSTNASPNNGEFTTLFDLNRVPLFFQAGDAAANMSTVNADQAHGDFTPGSVPGDFEAQYLSLNRVSNLLTTRSDCFTVYIVVQGWREAGTPFPVLDWEQRAAYIMDRSSGSIVATPVPTD